MVNKKPYVLKIKNTKGLSVVIGTVLLIALTLFIVAIVWGIINNIVQSETEGASACFGSFEEVKLNQRFTCYNSSGKELHFSINVKEVDLDGILVAISIEGSSINFELEEESSSIENLRMYSGGEVSAPGKNSGLTYIFDLGSAGFEESPDTIRIAPKIDGIQCEVSDTITEFESCSSLN
ncbi:MAG: hypothetical protein WDZ62_02555 [Candidatus Pacearchaeota archaeon]